MSERQEPRPIEEWADVLGRSPTEPGEVPPLEAVELEIDRLLANRDVIEYLTELRSARIAMGYHSALIRAKSEGTEGTLRKWANVELDSQDEERLFSRSQRRATQLATGETLQPKLERLARLLEIKDLPSPPVTDGTDLT